MARAKTLRFLLTPRVLFSGLVATGFVLVVILGMEAAQQAWFDQSVDPMFMGFLLGGGLISVPWAMWALAISVDGSASWRIGGDAELWTAHELHELGPRWHIEHNVPFPENGYVHDIDHVAVGPYGVLSVETKWTSATLDLGAKRLAKDVHQAMRQAEENAGRLRGLLRRVTEVDVIPLVVFWGRDVKAPAEPVRREGQVRIVAGKDADLWRQRLEAERLDSTTVVQLSERVHGWLVEQEEKTIGADRQGRLKQARRFARVSMTSTAIVIALFPASKVSKELDRVLGATFALGGGAVGTAIFLLPLLLAMVVLALTYVARRLDPTLSWSQGLAPLIFWCAGFGALAFVAS